MTTPTQQTITHAEFDKRLEDSIERKSRELQKKEEEQTRVEQLLTHFEHTLDEVEAELSDKDESLAYSTLLRKRLEELARKTTEVAMSL